MSVRPEDLGWRPKRDWTARESVTVLDVVQGTDEGDVVVLSTLGAMSLAEDARAVSRFSDESLLPPRVPASVNGRPIFVVDTPDGSFDAFLASLGAPDS